MFNFPRYLTSLYYKRCYPCHIIAFQNRTEIVNWAAEWEVGDMRWCSVKNQNLSHTSVLGCLSLLTRSGASCSPMQGQSMNWSSQPCTSHQQHSYQQPHPTPSAPVYLGPCYQATHLIFLSFKAIKRCHNTPSKCPHKMWNKDILLIFPPAAGFIVEPS